MTSLEIDDQLAEQLKQVAASEGCSPEEFIEEAIARHLDEGLDQQLKLTDAQKAHILQGIAQLERGEVVTSEEVDAFFEDWFKALDPR